MNQTTDLSSLHGIAYDMRQKGATYPEALTEVQKSAKDTNLGAFDILKIVDHEYQKEPGEKADLVDTIKQKVADKATELVGAGKALDDVKKKTYEAYVIQINPDFIAGEGKKDLDVSLTKKEVWDICEDVYADRTIFEFPKDFHYTDSGNAERLLDAYGGDIRYCPPWKCWYIWNNERWMRDDYNKIMILATEVVKSIAGEVNLIDSEDERRACLKWAFRSEDLNKKNNMVVSAAPYVPIKPQDLDSNPNLMTVKNGTVELDTLKFRPFRKSDYVSKMADVAYDPKSKCALWEKHLNMVFEGDQGFIRDFQMMCGYSLLGENPEQVFFILYGGGKNGKSVTLDVLQALLGDYSATLPAEALMENRSRSGGDATPELMAMVGARMVISGEADENCSLSEAMVKKWTGDSKVTVRGLYKDAVEISTTQKIFLATNHKPKIKGSDLGIWRRIWLLPFTHEIPEADRDLHIIEKLLDERDGIYMWMLEGLRGYIENGSRLRKPEKVSSAVETYKSENDILGQFITDCCVVDPDGRESKAIIRSEYVKWCSQNGEDPMSARKFNKIFREKGIVEGKSERYEELVDGAMRRVVGKRWTGVRLKNYGELYES